MTARKTSFIRAALFSAFIGMVPASAQAADPFLAAAVEFDPTLHQDNLDALATAIEQALKREQNWLSPLKWR